MEPSDSTIPRRDAGALDRLAPHPVLLAPMVGLSHFAVRQALAEFLAPGERTLWPTEMLSSRRVPSQRENQSAETCFLDKENGLCPQLLGNEEGFIRDSVAKLQSWGAIGIDINMGCPVQKALKHNYGVSLMGDASYAADVVAMTVAAADVPISVKLRAGFKDTTQAQVVAFAQGLARAGASWITLHPRKAEQQRRGYADWELVRIFRRELSVPVIGNGDVQCVEDMRTFFNTGCDRLMVGRALMGKPWLIAAARFNSTTGEVEYAPEPSPEEQTAAYRKFLLRVIELMQAHYEPAAAMRKLRFLVFHGHVWFEFGHGFHMRIQNAPTLGVAAQIVREDFDRQQKVSQHTMLRG